MRELTEEELLQAIQSCGPELHGRIALTYESGPYDIDRPTIVADKLARAIQRKFIEVNALGVRVCAITDVECSRGCYSGPCKLERKLNEQGVATFTDADVDEAAKHCGISDGHRELLAHALRDMHARGVEEGGNGR